MFIVVHFQYFNAIYLKYFYGPYKETLDLNLKQKIQIKICPHSNIIFPALLVVIRDLLKIRNVERKSHPSSSSQISMTHGFPAVHNYGEFFPQGFSYGNKLLAWLSGKSFTKSDWNTFCYCIGFRLFADNAFFVWIVHFLVCYIYKNFGKHCFFK